MIKFNNLWKTYGRGSNAVTALNGMTGSFGKGIHMLVGPNGSGKSSLIKILSTLTAPKEGELAFQGRVIDRSNVGEYRKHVAYMPQSFTFDESLTLMKTCSYIGWIRGVNSNVVKQRSVQHAAELGISELLDRKMNQMSGGQKRISGFLLSILSDPDVILLDEPTVGLDEKARAKMRAVIKAKAESAVVVVSTHLVEDMENLNGDLAVIDDGRMLRQEPWRQSSIREAALTSGAAKITDETLEGVRQ